MSLRCFQAEVLLPWEQEFPSQSSSCVLFEFFFLKMVFFSIFPWEMSTRLLRVNLVCVCVCMLGQGCEWDGKRPTTDWVGS